MLVAKSIAKNPYKFMPQIYLFSEKKTLSYYCKIFNLPVSYTDEQLKNSYLELVKKYHPDLNKQPSAKQKFQQIQEAYDILSDPSKIRYLDDSEQPKPSKKKRQTKANEQQDDDSFLGEFQERFADRYQRINKKNEGMQFSYNLYKKHYEQVQTKKKEYKRFSGNEKAYYAKQSQKGDNIIKTMVVSGLIVGIVSGSIWFVNLKQ